MTWEELYGNCTDWSSSKLSRAIDQLDDYGDADDVLDVINLACNVEQADKLIEKCLDAKVVFKQEHIEDMLGSVSDSVLAKAMRSLPLPLSPSILETLAQIDRVKETGDYIVFQLMRQGYHFTEEEINDISHTVSANILETLFKLAEPDTEDEFISNDDSEEILPLPVIKTGFFASLISTLFLSDLLSRFWDWAGGKNKE